MFGWEGGGLLDMPASKTTFRKQHLKDRGGLAEHLQLVKRNLVDLKLVLMPADRLHDVEESTPTPK